MDSLHDVRSGIFRRFTITHFWKIIGKSCWMFYGIHHKRSRINDKIHLHFNSETPVFEMIGDIPVDFCGTHCLHLKQQSYTIVCLANKCINVNVCILTWGLYSTYIVDSK